MTQGVVAAGLEQRVGDARSHLDLLLRELDRRRRALERQVTGNLIRVGGGLVVALVLAMGTYAIVRGARRRREARPLAGRQANGVQRSQLRQP